MAETSTTDTEFCPIQDAAETISSKIPVPRKGILKRSSSFHSRFPNDNEQRDVLSPLRSEAPKGYSAPVSNATTPDTPTSKIPKPSVKWETNAGQDQEHINSSDDDDEQVSVGSSVGSSIAGTWWFGRDKRFVPHCQRRQMKDDDATPYVTPTQRKNRELLDLRKKLKQANQMLNDKEQHLSQLRERLTELETMMESGGGLTETMRLRSRVRQLEEQIDAEAKKLTEKYEGQMRHLQRQNIDNMEVVRKASIAEIESRKPSLSECGVTVKPEIRTKGSMTNLTGKVMDESSVSELHNELNAYKLEFNTQQQTISQLQNKIKDMNMELLDVEHTLCQRTKCVQYRMEMSQHLEAFKCECIAWRQKASELEMAYKIQQQQVITLQQAMEKPPTPVMVDSGIDVNVPLVHQQQNGCNRESCITKKQQLSEENASLAGKITELEAGIADLADDNSRLQIQVEFHKEKSDEMEAKAKKCEKEASNCLAKHEAAQITVTRLNGENLRLMSLMEDLRGETDMQRKTLMDAGIISSKRRTSLLPGAMLCLAKESQTDLTSESLNDNEKEFSDLSGKIAELEVKLREEQGDWSVRLGEIQASLSLKTQLVNTLTSRIQSMNEEFEKARDTMERERKEYVHKLDDLGRIASRVPILEIELERAREDRQVAEIEVMKMRDSSRQAVEDTMTAGMKNQRDSDDYWKQKLTATQQQFTAVSKELDKTQKQFRDSKMRLNLEKVDLEQRLSESYKEVAELHDKIYKNNEDKETMAYPETQEQDCTCQPECDEFGTQILKGELFDETEEKLKLVQGELLTTRRQVEVLQDRFKDKCEETTSMRDVLDEASSEKQGLEHNLQSLKRELLSLQGEHLQTQDNYDKMRRMADEDKADMVRREKDRFGQLETEFEQVRQELDAVIQKYEAEKNKMTQRIAVLEVEVKQKQKLQLELARLKKQAETESYEIDVQILGQKLNELCATSEEQVFAEIRSAPSTPHPVETRKRNAAVQFLLNRLQEERVKHRNQTDNLKKEIQELTSEVDAMQHFGQRRFSLTKTTSNPDLSVPEGSSGTTTVDSHTIANLRAKNLCLLKENRDLTSQLAELRDRLTIMMAKHSTPEPAEEKEEGKEVEKKVISMAVEPFLAVSRASPVYSNEPQTQTNTDLASDLKDMRVDLEGIITQIDSTTANKSLTSTAVREGRIMRWLETELQEEKRELDVLTKWYENDKRRMADENSTVRDERDSLQVQLDRMSLDYHDVCRELELYKREDSASIARSKTAGGKLARSASYTDLILARSENANWKCKYGTLFREFLKVERDFVLVNKERKEYKQECDMIGGEIEVLRLELELEKGGETIIQPRKVQQEAAEAPSRESSDAFDDARDELLQHQLDQTRSMEKKLKGENSDLLNTNKQLQSQIKQLKSSLEEQRNDSDQIRVDLETSKQINEALDTQINLMEKKRSEKLPDDASKKMVQQLMDRLDSQELANKHALERAEDRMEEQRLEHLNEVQRLEQELFESKQTQHASLPKIDSIQRSKPLRSLDSTTIETASSMRFDDAWSWTAETSFHTPPSSTAASSYQCIHCLKHSRRRLMGSDPAIRVRDTEDKLVHSDKEVEMLTRELDLCREGRDKEVRKLQTENEDLRNRLYQAVLVAEKVIKPAELQQAMDTACNLQQKLDELRIEKEQCDREHQEMYLTMFKKGQDTMRAEMLESQGLGKSSHSLDSDISYPFPCRAGVVEGEKPPGYLTEEQAVLRFLRDAVYYFLLNKDTKEHLHAIMSLLKFSELQRSEVSKIRRGSGH